MKLIALGTGTSQGVPIIGCQCKACLSSDSRDKRLRSTVYIESEKTKLLIDVGPDFRQQFLTNGLDDIDFVLFTHEHNDHVIGIDEVRAINFIKQKSIPFFAEQRVLESIKMRFHYAFAESKIPGLPQISLHQIDDTPFNLNDLVIEPIRVTHGRLPILGYKIGDLAYITDASFIEESEIDKIKNIKHLIINALRLEKHYSHFNLEQSLEVIKKINPEKAYLTHISHLMGPTAEWIGLLPDHVVPLEDNMCINF